MKKLLCTVLAAVFLVISAVCSWADYFDEGHYGLSESDAYVIDSLEDLILLRDRVNEGKEPRGRYYRLTQNIDMQNPYNSNTAWSSYRHSIGKEENTPFEGHFNGNGNTITTRGTTLFGYIKTDGTAIKNLNVTRSGNTVNEPYGGIASALLSGIIENCNVSGNINLSSNKSAVGGIAGRVGAEGVIKNCNFNGSLSVGCGGSGTNYYNYAGGIAGSTEGGTIENCTVTITDSIYAYTGGSGGTEVKNSSAGGVVGMATESSTIRNCEVTGSVRSKQWAGGIAGYMQGGTITNCYVLNTSTIEGNHAAGGIAGYLGGNAVASGNAIVLMSRVEAVAEAVGGIVGHLNSGTVKNNRAYTAVDGRAKYQGTIIGEATGYPNTVTGNYYNVSGSAVYVIGYDGTLSAGSNEGGNQHAPETIEQIKGNDPDPTPVDPTPVTTINITKSSLASGTVGAAYNDMLTANISGVTWSISSGSLPAGLTLNASTGTITGTPTTAGSYPVTFTAASGSNSASKAFTITINAPQTELAITSTGPINGQVGQALTFTLTANISGVTWSASGLPGGLALNSSTGRITGTPTTSGNYTLNVTAQANGQTVSKTLSMVISPASTPDPVTPDPVTTITILNSSLPNASVGSPYSASLFSDASSVTWSVSSGSLPAGLNLNASTGTISGTPTRAGNYTFTLRASKSSGSGEKSFTITVNENSSSSGNSFAITTMFLSDGTVGTPYNQQLTASNGNNIVWRVTNGALPGGLALSQTGLLSGTPTTAGTTTIEITANDGTNRTASYFTLTINPVGSLSVTSSSEIRAKVNEGVNFTFTANISGVKWYADASLPAGLTLNPDSGALRGTPTVKGTYPFTVTAIGNGQSATRYITFIVEEASNNEEESGGSGGCNSLSGLCGLVFLAGIFLLRKN